MTKIAPASVVEISGATPISAKGNACIRRRAAAGEEGIRLFLVFFFLFSFCLSVFCFFLFCAARACFVYLIFIVISLLIYIYCNLLGSLFPGVLRSDSRVMLR